MSFRVERKLPFQQPEIPQDPYVMRVSGSQFLNVLELRALANGAGEQPFEAVRDYLSPGEIGCIQQYAEAIPLGCDYEIPFNSDTVLLSLAVQAENDGHLDAADVLRKAEKHLRICCVSKEHIGKKEAFGQLDTLLQWTLLQLPDDEAEELRVFLERGGILVYTENKGPTSRLIHAVESSEGHTIDEKLESITQCPNEKVQDALHSFTHVRAVSPSKGDWISGQTSGIADSINNVMNLPEGEFSQELLKMGLYSSELANSLGAIALALASGAGFHYLETRFHENPAVAVASQILSPVIADLATFWIQSQQLIEGESLKDRVTMFMEHLRTTYKYAATISLAFTAGGVVAANALESRLGTTSAGWIYSLVPFAVAMITTFSTAHEINKRNILKGLDTALSSRSQFAVNTGAAVTTAVSGVVLGNMGYLNHADIVALIHAGMEHGLAGMGLVLWNQTDKLKSVKKRLKVETKEMLADTTSPLLQSGYVN